MSNRTFPIMNHGEPKCCPSSIPWDIIAGHEEQAYHNHGQSLELLASRGGLSPCEAVAILEDRGWVKERDREVVCKRLLDLAGLC